MAVNLDDLPLPDELPVIPEGWNYESLGDLVEERGVSYGIVQPGSETTDGVPIVRVNNIRNGRIDTSDMLKVGADIEAKFQRSRLRGGEVLLTLVGTLGEVAIAPKDLCGWNVARAVGVIPVRKEPGSEWVAICLRSRFIQRCIRTWATTTVQATFNLGDLVKLPIPVPPKEVRDRVSKILGSLEDKIELNRRVNATLDGMARALFQSWFVDFEPVRSKLDNVRPLYVDEVTAKLFPAHLVESPVGKVPQGWQVLKFADFLTPHSCRVGEVSVPEYSATVTGLFPRDERFKKQLSKSQSKNKRIVEGELVFGFSREVINFGLMRAPVGSVSPVYEVFRIDCSKIEPEILERLFRFNMPYYMDILKLGAREGKPIDRDYLLRKHLLVPDIAVQRAFLATIQPWTDKIKANEAESRTLATLRDTLLPKLLSGELSATPEN